GNAGPPPRMASCPPRHQPSMKKPRPRRGGVPAPPRPQCIKKRPDTVGQPQSAENCVWHMPSLQAQEPGESEVIAIVVSRGNRLTNSIRPFLRRLKNRF